MSTHAQVDEPDDAADLAALGKAYTPPQAPDTSPEVSDVIATMPWWAARGLLYIILGFAVAAFAWAWLSKIDVAVEARGKLVPEGYVKLVQAASPGTVQSVFVHEGETVAQGEPLVQLDATEMRARLARLREELAASQQQLRQLLAAGPVTQTLEQQSRIARLQSEIAATELGLRQTTITSPAAGIVTSLDVRGGGEVLQAGQSVASIAPTDAPLIVEAHVSNRDIAFVEPGLNAKLKLDAFPYQDYGTIEGAVSEVAPDAQTDKEEGSFYKVLIKPSRLDVVVKGKAVALRPGLSLSASIITERKSVLSLLFEPFRK